MGFFTSGKALTAFAFQDQVLPIWLPAGAALVAAYIWGWRFIPGLLLASFTFNWSTTHGWQLQTWSLSTASQILIIVVGTITQAMVGGYILRYWLGHPLYMTSRKHILYFVLILGIAVNLISANIGVLSFSFYHPDYSFTDHWQNMLAWWLGDSLGVLIFSPICLILINPWLKNPVPNHNALGTLTTCIALFSSVAMTTYLYNQNNGKNANIAAEREVKIIEHSIYRYVNLSMLAIQGLANKLQATPNLTHHDFKEISNAIRAEYTFLGALSWNEYIQQHDVASLNKELKHLYGPQVTITGMPAKPSDPLVVVKYISPQPTNLSAFGVNVYAKKTQFATLNKALNGLQPQTSPIIFLEQATRTSPAYQLTSPVYRDKGPNTYDLLGYVTGIIQVDALLGEVLKQTTAQYFDIAFYNGENKTPFYQNFEHSNTEYSARWTIPIYLSGQKWHMKLAVKKVHTTQQNKIQTLFFLILQITITTLIVFIVLLFNYQHHALNELVTRRTRSLARAKQASDKANQAKSRFLANMSHEIRTPLNAVIGFASLATDNKSPSQLHSYIGHIGSASKTLLNLVNDILDITKIESNRLHLDCHIFELHALLKRLDAMFTASASHKGVSWEVNHNLQGEYWLYGDEMRIEQILLNLCSNAVKFTQHGGVTVTLAIHETSPNAQLRISIADTGIGIDQSQHDTIFNAFTQADNSTSRDFGGTGLGLAIAKELTDLMHGSLTLESQLNHGSCFMLEIECQTARAATTKNRHIDLKKLERLHILVAEDNAVNKLVIKAMLDSFHITYTIVENGQQAVNAVELGEFDLVLMDCQMPVMDGYQATALIRQHKDTEKLPIIALTADVMPQDKAHALAVGFNQHLAKPLDRDKLARCLAQYC
jgi:signal transduction histidine kinase/CheY-like chemotaxis protein